MTISQLLACQARDVARDLNLPIGFEGEAFIVPCQTHLRCKIGPGKAKLAALGPHAPIRLDGSLELSVITPPGEGTGEADEIAARIMARFPPGFGLDYAGPLGNGELVFSAPVVLSGQADAGNVAQTVKIGFYAIIFPAKEEQQWQK